MKGAGNMQTLKAARAARLLTVRGLAEAAGVAPSTVYLIENGRSVPRFEAIRKLSEALGVDPAEIAEFAAAIAEAGQGKDHAAALIETMAAAG
jgi:transcriptional regulator with XRE-family HTH domain